MTRLEAPASRHRIALLGLCTTLALLLSVTLPGQSPGAHGPRCDGKHATIVGNSRANTLNGTGHRDVIVGLGGADTINGRGGNDLICGGAGNDKLRGGNGEDTLLGGINADDLFGNEEQDELDGGIGPDGLDGGNGNDSLSGGPDNDELFGGPGVELFMFGGDGNDELHGEGGPDTPDGGDGDDKIFGGEKDDDLSGGTGIDLCDPGPGPSDQKVAECEADLRLDLSGPATAPAGVITYTVTVRNNGPSPVIGYTLTLDSDNSHLQCDGLFDDVNPRPALAVGQSRADHYAVDCVLEGDSPHSVTFEVELSAASPATDPHPSNNSSLLASTLVE